MTSSGGVIQLAVHERGVAILIPGESHRPSLSSLASSTVTAPVYRSYRRRIDSSISSGDPIHYMYVLLFPYSTDGFHLDMPKEARRSQSRLWNSAAGD